MFVVAIDKKNELTATPIIWVKRTENKTGYYWPLYGLLFKLKNYVPLPVQSQELKNEWRHVPCRILLNGKKFKTYQDAEKAILKILKEGKGGHSSGATEESEMEWKEVQSNEVETKNVESDEEQSDEEQSDEEQSDEEQSDEEQSVEPESVDVVSEEMEEQKSDKVLEQQTNKVVEQQSDEDDENFENFPLEEYKNFKANEVFLEQKSGFNQLKEFYVKINESSERKFFNECVKRTFSDSFLLANITFKKDTKRKNEEDWVGVFDETRLYKCLKKAMVEKLKLRELDESKLKAKFVTNFDRIKRAIRARH